MAISKIEFNFAQYNDGSEAGPTYETISLGQETLNGTVQEIRKEYIDERPFYRVMYSNRSIYDIFNVSTVEWKPVIVIKRMKQATMHPYNAEEITDLVEIHSFDTLDQIISPGKHTKYSKFEYRKEAFKDSKEHMFNGELKLFDNSEEFIEAVKEHFQGYIIKEMGIVK